MVVPHTEVRFRGETGEFSPWISSRLAAKRRPIVHPVYRRGFKTTSGCVSNPSLLLQREEDPSPAVPLLVMSQAGLFAIASLRRW